MEKLTSVRCSGIKSGYWSPRTKEEVVQKLGAIEHRAEGLLDELCDICGGSLAESIPNGPEKACLRCPVNRLAELIGGE